MKRNIAMVAALVAGCFGVPSRGFAQSEFKNGSTQTVDKKNFQDDYSHQSQLNTLQRIANESQRRSCHPVEVRPRMPTRRRLEIDLMRYAQRS